MTFNIKLLEKSFARIRTQEAKFVARFYINLFNDYPQLQPLFANTDMEVQEKKLMMSLVLVINNLRNLAYLTTILKDLGEKHVRYGAIREHYPMLGVTLFKTLESFLGEDWTPAVKQAWIEGYEEIVNLMIEGANHSQDISQLENISQPSTNAPVLGQTPTPPPTTHSRNYPQENSESDTVSQPSVQPARKSQIVTPTPARSSRRNYVQEISKLEDVSQPSGQLPSSSQTPAPPPTTVSGVNLKLLVSIFAIVSLLGVGLLYYQSSSQRDNNNIELR